MKQAIVAALVASAGGLAWAGPAKEATVSVSLAHPYLMADRPGQTYIKVGLTGCEPEPAERRAPVNVALVVDKSGSMSGEKIAKAREAALYAVDRLGPQDIVAVVAYDDTVSVLVPATRASDRSAIRAGIERLEPGGSTALFAGVSKGAAEVRKFLRRDRVNRVILISDGLANVGPGSPGALGELGASLIREGISVTTIGLGLDYNEDLMTQLAMKSDGNHAFVEHSRDLARIFDRELGDVLSVVAKEVVVRIRCADGVRLVRVLGRDAEVAGGEAVAYINQLYGSQEKYVLAEIEVPPGRGGTTRDVAAVGVTYVNLATGGTDRLTRVVAAAFTDAPDLVVRHEDRDAQEAVVLQIAAENSRRAVQLRDEGKVEEARRELLDNVEYLGTNAARLESQTLEQYKEGNRVDAENLDDSDWGERRKVMRKSQHAAERQQAW